MKYLSTFDNLNEEWLSRKQRQTPPKKEFIKTSLDLIKKYTNNLLTDDFMKIHLQEKWNYDFDYYKVKSIAKVGKNKFDIWLTTYDSSYVKLDDVNYLLEI